MGEYTSIDQNDSSSSEPLLDDESVVRHPTDDYEKHSRSITFQHRSWMRRHILGILAHLILVTVNLGFCLTFLIWSSSRLSHGPQNANSPARDVINFEARRFELLSVYLPDGTLNPNKPTSFSGPPRPELDEAWSNLTKHQNIRIHEDELGELAGDGSLVKLSDGSGYYGSLAVFHGLHCVERFHHYMHKDVYYKDLTDEDLQRLEHHTEHCLDWLRQSIQCNADTSIMMMRWDADRSLPIARDTGEHQCVNWEPFRQWVEERSFDAFKPGLLVHPKYGSVFDESVAGSKGDKIGIVSGSKLLQSSGTP